MKLKFAIIENWNHTSSHNSSIPEIFYYNILLLHFPCMNNYLLHIQLFQIIHRLSNNVVLRHNYLVNHLKSPVSILPVTNIHQLYQQFRARFINDVISQLITEMQWSIELKDLPQDWFSAMYKQVLVIEASGPQTYVNSIVNRDMKSRRDASLFIRPNW